MMRRDNFTIDTEQYTVFFFHFFLAAGDLRLIVIVPFSTTGNSIASLLSSEILEAIVSTIVG